MSAPELLVRPQAVDDAQLPDLETYVLQAAHNHCLGATNANLLLACEGVDFSGETRGLLAVVAEGATLSYLQAHDYVAPLLRGTNCFETHDVWRINRLGKFYTWEFSDVWAPDFDPEDESQRRGIVIFSDDTRNGLNVEWPAMLPEQLHKDLEKARFKTETSALVAKGIGKVFFELSYYDPAANEPKFRNAIDVALSDYLLR